MLLLLLLPINDGTCTASQPVMGNFQLRESVA